NIFLATDSGDSVVLVLSNLLAASDIVDHSTQISRLEPNIRRSEMDSSHPAPAEAFDELVSALRASLTPAITPSSAFASPMALPFFLLQVSKYIEMQPQRFTTEKSKVAFLLSLLSVRMLLWARVIWNSQSNIINSFHAFTDYFKEVFRQSAGSLRKRMEGVGFANRLPAGPSPALAMGLCH
uniref:DUF4939 domain-containing protein n=1 Tax=Sinocyclocheilus anshuiensis TaxID=1608454 RepID=A0A671KE49_9TELE